MRILCSLLLLATIGHAETHLAGYDPRKHLVCDERVIESVVGLKLMPGVIEKHAGNPLFQADKLWENALNNLYPNVHFDTVTDTFHLWYKCVLNDPPIIAKLAPVHTIHDQGWLLLHAESKDGIAWKKPEHGIVEFDGNKANNAVCRDTPNVGVFFDAHDADPQRRYKLVFDTGLGQLQARFSADGLHWAEPVKLEGFGPQNGDTHTNAFFDEPSGKYVLFTKRYLGQRLIARFESDDFIHWRGGEIVMRSTREEGVKTQTYCMEVFPYGSGYLSYVMLYNPGKDRSVDCELAWSPDTKQWTRLFPGTPFIPRGAKGSYDSLCIYAPAGQSIVRDGKHYILYGGSETAHLGWKRHCLPCAASLPEDGWVALKGTGSMTTQPMLATGEPIKLSASVAQGSVRVTIIDEAGFEQSDAITADVTNAPVHWANADASKLKGKLIRLRFDLINASLHAFSGTSQTGRVAPKKEVKRSSSSPATKVTLGASFDRDAEGWLGLEKLEHHADEGYVSISRAKNGPFAIAPLTKLAGGKYAGDWSKLFGDAGATITFKVRAKNPGTATKLEIWADEAAPWTLTLPPAGKDWTTLSGSLRTDWNDAEATAAGWKRLDYGFSWQETITHVGKVVIVPMLNPPSGSFDLDEVTIESR